MEEKLNLFDVLKNINNKNFDYIDNLPEKLQKQFSTYMTYQWLTCTDNDTQVMLLAKYVNDAVLPLANHPRLLYKLFCVTSCGRNTRYNWKYTKKDTSLKLEVVAKYYDCSKRIAKLHMEDTSDEDIKQMAYDLGYQDAELKKLFK